MYTHLVLFYLGNSLLTLQTYREKLSNFSLSHPIEVFQDGHLLNTSRHWHTDFDMLVVSFTFQRLFNFNAE